LEVIKVKADGAGASAVSRRHPLFLKSSVVEWTSIAVLIPYIYPAQSSLLCRKV